MQNNNIGVLGFPKKKWINKTHTHTYQELAHVIMEGKSHHLPSASCKSREDGGIIWSQAFGLRIRGAGGVNLIQDQKMRCDVPAQPAKQVKKGWVSPSSVFCSSHAFNGLDNGHPYWGGQFTESTDSNVR